ncbi:hypothetical protein TBK1r_33110 [Stieleria magnilauensis]|uniref:Uncharacterized protein n=1 Tax=Stieleria magnilauensis TaxID=2527963 RepID=A0ABX5XSS3_9BACT|nr:hypothetical protein TBK1r_33110 [Planctomycetes bacterium TBK1r]
MPFGQKANGVDANALWEGRVARSKESPRLPAVKDCTCRGLGGWAYQSWLRPVRRRLAFRVLLAEQNQRRDQTPDLFVHLVELGIQFGRVSRFRDRL